MSEYRLFLIQRASAALLAVLRTHVPSEATSPTPCCE